MKPFQVSQTLSESEHFVALSRIGAALMSELDEKRLLHLIAQTAVDLTGAEFAAFTLRPVNEQGEFLVPSEGNLFHLVEVIGVTQEQEEQFRRQPLGGEGVLAPIFRYGVPVRVADILQLMGHGYRNNREARQAAREVAAEFAHGHASPDKLHSMGVPHGHPLIRSFLGAPLLDRDMEVRGGLLLGHSEPDQFNEVDEQILMGLAAQAAVAVENARLYRAMRTRANELQAIFESIADGVTLIDQQGQIIRENQRAIQLRQQLEKDAQGRQALEALLHAPARSALQKVIEHDVSVTIVNEQNERCEYIVNAAPLYRISPQANANPIATSEGTNALHAVTGAVVVWHDVTEARRLQQERRIHAETEARRSLLQRILDELPSSVYLVHGKEARLVLANEASRTVWGATWPREQPMVKFLQRNSIHIFDINGCPLPHERLATLRAVQKGETIYQHQEIIRHADGSTLPVLVNAIVLDTHKLPISLSLDTSSPNELFALVVHQSVSALKEAEALKDEFIGIAAHELRNPLAALQGFVQLLLSQATQNGGDALSAIQHESLQSIDQASKRLRELTDDLLDVTRLQAGRLELHQDPTDLISLVKRVVKRFQMTEEKHQFVFSVQEDFLVVFIDVQRIEQVLNNILGNAVKYSPQGGLIEVTLTKEPESGRAILSVKDDGIGIPTQQQAHIFGRFIRAENAQSRGIQGTGLGLYLSRELIERHGGRIWFQSTEGQGSTFFISLPLISLPEEEEENA